MSITVKLRYLTLELSLLPPAGSLKADHLIGQVVKASALRVEDLGFESRLHWEFSGLSHTSDLKIGAPVATLLGAWHDRVSAETGWPNVNIL